MDKGCWFGQMGVLRLRLRMVAKQNLETAAAQPLAAYEDQLEKGLPAKARHQFYIAIVSVRCDVRHS